MAPLVAAYFSRFYFYTLLIRFIFTNNYYYCFVISIRLYFKILIMERWCDLSRSISIN